MSITFFGDLQCGTELSKNILSEKKTGTGGRKKCTKSRIKSYDVDAQNICATSSKLTVTIPDRINPIKEGKKRRAFDDLGNKNIFLDQKRQKKTWLQSKPQIPMKTEKKNVSYEKENFAKKKSYKVFTEVLKSDVQLQQIKLDSNQQASIFSSNKLRPKVLPARSTTFKETKWDFTNLSRAIENVIFDPPDGIVDIDDVCKDYFYCPDFARDIVAYLQKREKFFEVNTGYLKDDPEVNPNMRSILIDWLVQVQNHLNLNQSTLHLTIALIDLYLMKKRTPLSRLQLIGITCLLIASKFEERFAPSVDKLVHLTDNTYSYDNVIQMELIILKVLKFDIHPPIAIDFLDRYLMCLPIYIDLENICRYVLDLALHDFNSMEFVPSVRAAASIYLGCSLIPNIRKNMEKPWTDELKFYTGYEDRDLFNCVERFARLLLKAPKSKFQGAREKYAHSSFKSVSNFPCLGDPALHNIAIGKHACKLAISNQMI